MLLRPCQKEEVLFRFLQEKSLLQKKEEMKASELRIGNFINAIEDNSICKVEGINSNSLSVITKGRFGNQVIVSDIFDGFSPIQLTEEWLLVFVFSKDNACWIGEPFNDGLMPIILNANLQLYYEDEVDEYNMVSRPLKYVHQLQNLYFALTGEEVEVK